MKQKIISFGGPPRRTSGAEKTAQVDKRRRRRRTGRHTLHYILIMLVAAAIIAILSLTVFFRVETIEVKGVTRYSAAEIIDVSGIEPGDNLFRISPKQVLKKVAAKYPYVEKITLKRSFPAKLTLVVTQAKALGVANTAAGYVVIGQDGRILESGISGPPDGVTVVNGMYLASIVPGRKLGEPVIGDEIVYPKELEESLPAVGEKPKEYTEAQKKTMEAEKRAKAAELETENLDMLLSLVKAVTDTGFTDITLVDFSDRLNMMLVYDNRVIVELGSQGDLNYKLEFVKSSLVELGGNFQGILDASLAATSKGVWSQPCDVAQELLKRSLAVQQKAATPTAAATPPAVAGGTSESSAAEAVPDPSTDLYAVKPKPPGEVSSAASGAESSSSSSTASATGGAAANSAG